MIVYSASQTEGLMRLCVNSSKVKFLEIDKVLARHYGFTVEELDFIINYDIKYRMGGVLEDINNG